MVAVVGVVLLTAACDDPPTTPSPSSPSPQPPPGVQQITGRERIGWDQPAASAAELATLAYNMYVDNTATRLTGVACSPTAGPAGYACNAQLPPLSPGAHTLEMSALVSVNAALESGRSVPLRVFVLGGAVEVTADGRSRISTRDGVSIGVEVVAGGLIEPTDLAISAGGRIFVAERSGRVVTVDERRLGEAAALTIPDVHAAGRSGLLAIALDPEFERSGLVFAAYTSLTGFELARFRLVAATAGERVVLLDRIEASPVAPAASLEVGPDGLLYVAFDDGGNAQAAGDLGSFNGKVLRLEHDGTTPADQAGGTPVYAINVNAPRGLDWNADGSTMWVLERDPDGEDRVQAVVAESSQSKRGTATARYSLPTATGAADLVVYRGALFPAFHDDLLVAADEGRAILRLGIDQLDRSKIISTERLLRDAVGSIRALAVAADGTIYLATADTLLKLVGGRY